MHELGTPYLKSWYEEFHEKVNMFSILNSIMKTAILFTLFCFALSAEIKEFRGFEALDTQGVNSKGITSVTHNEDRSIFYYAVRYNQETLQEFGKIFVHNVSSNSVWSFDVRKVTLQAI